MRRLIVALWFLLALCPPALAHEGGAHTHGLWAGLIHPMLGIDHLLAMIGVGVLAASLSGHARWSLPLAFLLSMTLAAALAMGGVIASAPAEHLVALSLTLLGLPLALALRPALPAAIALVAVCAAVHGHAHGAESPVSASAAAYVAGFALSTAFLHAAGWLLGQQLLSHDQKPLLRVGGGLLASAGVVLLMV